MSMCVFNVIILIYASPSPTASKKSAHCSPGFGSLGFSRPGRPHRKRQHDISVDMCIYVYHRNTMKYLCMMYFMFI